MGLNYLVTGGASGIGAALVSRLSRHGRVLAIDRAEAACDTILADLADEASTRAAARAAAAHGPFAGLALVAGVPGTAPPATVMAVNLAAPVLLTAELAPHLTEGASVVAVSSVTAHRCTLPDADLDALIDGGYPTAHATPLDGLAAYETSKRALNRWVQREAARLHPRARVNGVSPGPTRTPILADFEASMGKARLDAAAALTGRHGMPEDIAAVIDWLLTGESGWVNGIDLKADGGFHALRAASNPT